MARLDQTLHEQVLLISIWIQSEFKRSHSSSYHRLDGICQAVPPADGWRFTPMAQARGTYAALMVDYRVQDGMLYNTSK